MKRLFLLILLTVVSAANYTFVPNATYLGKPVVNSTLPELDMGDVIDIAPKLVSMSSFMNNNADAVYSVDTNKYGIQTARVFLQLFLTPDKKAWDTAKTISGFAWDGPGDVGIWKGKCYDVGRVQRALIAFETPETATNIAMYMACYPESKATLWIAKDGYTIKSIAAPEFVNDGKWAEATDSIWTNNKLQSTCKNPRALEGLNKGAPGDCCMYTTDCAGDNVCDFNGRCALCSTAIKGRRTGDYINGQCCNVDEDCSGRCLDGRCAGRCNEWPLAGLGVKAGVYGQCCGKDVDCVGTCDKDGFCSDVSGCNRSHGKKDGKFGDCCSTKEDCTSPGVCKHPTYVCQADDSYCAGRKLGLKDGKEGDCCKTGVDCLSGSCPLGLCTAPLLNCITGYETRTDKSLDSRYCCANDNSCIGACVDGICGYKSHDGCVTGSEEYNDGNSGDGDCCMPQFGSCGGDCVNGICVVTSSNGECKRCILGHEGDGNTNLSPKYCCKDGSDCLFGCTNGACVAGSVSSCPKPTKTTSTSTPTQTSKPKPTSVKPIDICVGVCGPGPVVVALPGLAIGFVGAFIPLLGHDDDDTTTTTTTTKSTTTTTKSTTTTTKSTTTSSASTTSSTTGTTNTITSSVTTGPTNSATTTTPTNNTTMPTGNTSTITTPTNGITTVSTNGTVTSVTTITNGNGSTTNSVTIPVTSTTSSTIPVTSISIIPVTSNSTITTPVTSTTSSTIPVITITSSATTTVTSTTSSTTPVTTITSSTTTTPVTSTTSSTTTAVPTGKTCKSGYFKKNLKNAPDGSCCATSGDCVGDCVYVPGDSYMCKNGSMTTTITASSTTTDTTTTPKPTPTCIMGHCGLGIGKGPTGACCADQWDCDDTCNANGKCGLSDGTWTTKLPCP